MSVVTYKFTILNLKYNLKTFEYTRTLFLPINPIFHGPIYVRFIYGRKVKITPSLLGYSLK